MLAATYDRPRFMSLLEPRQEEDEHSDDDDEDHDDKKSKKKKDNKDDDDDQDDDKKDEKPKSKWPLVILAVLAVLVVIAVVVFWFLTRNQESTDDAYTEGNAVAIAPKVSGYVIERSIDDNSFVHAGDLMLRIDPRDYINARDQARANLDLARAQLRSAEIDLEIARVRYPADRQQTEAQLAQARANQINAGREYVRQHTVDRRATTQATIDQATTQFESARANTEQIQAQLNVASLVRQNVDNTGSTLKQRQAQVEQAEASLAQAELNLSYTHIRAPQDGWITRRNVDVGTYAQAGQQVFYVVSPQTWVVANFKETQLDRMHIGQHVTITVDAYSKLRLHGHIDSIQQGSGARFTAFPSENATGNYVKIVRRVPVKIVIDSGLDSRVGLPLGLSVEPTVDLK
jgi:membrane fusion protein (multidrug efflux system)